MIVVNVWRDSQTGQFSPAATLDFTGEGKAVKISTSDKEVEAMLKELLTTSLGMPKQGIVPPDPREDWMKALPNALVSVPYWFSIDNDESEVQEEVSNDIEEDIEESDEEDYIDDDGDDTSDGGDDDSDGDDDGDEGDDDGDSLNSK